MYRDEAWKIKYRCLIHSFIRSCMQSIVQDVDSFIHTSFILDLTSLNIKFNFWQDIIKSFQFLFICFWNRFPQLICFWMANSSFVDFKNRTELFMRREQNPGLFCAQRIERIIIIISCWSFIKIQRQMSDIKCFLKLDLQHI